MSSRLPAAKPGESRFLPVSTERLRVTSAEPLRRLEARLDADADRYFGEIEQSRIDLLGSRFREMPHPDLAAAKRSASTSGLCESRHRQARR